MVEMFHGSLKEAGVVGGEGRGGEVADLIIAVQEKRS